MRDIIPGGFTIDDFSVDLTARTVTCPAGHAVRIHKGGGASFSKRCIGCPLRDRCTTATGGRHVTLHPQFGLMQAARLEANRPEFQQELKQWRPMAERAIAWLVAKGHRRVPYRGIKRNELWLGHRSAGLNLRRLLVLGLHLGPEGWAVA